MSTSSGMGAYYGYRVGDQELQAALLNGGYDADCDASLYSVASPVATLPATLSSTPMGERMNPYGQGNASPWSGYWDAEGNWVD